MAEDSITKVFNRGRHRGRIVWQKYIDGQTPELPVLVHIDNGDSLILSQEGRDIVLNPDTVPDLLKAIKQSLKA